MDGFHLSNQVLSELGLSERKGAPDTFDVSGFLSLLHRIKSAANGPIYFPVFDRNVEESIAAQGVISPGAQLVVVEGNYLCHDKDGWEKISPILDESWCLEIDEDVR